MAIWYARLEGCGHVNLEPLWLYVSLMATEGLSLPNLVETYLSGSIPPTITLAPCVLLSELRRWILKDQSSHHPKGVAMAASRSHWQKAIGKVPCDPRADRRSPAAEQGSVFEKEEHCCSTKVKRP